MILAYPGTGDEDEDLNETARLVIMDNPACNMREFGLAVREVRPDTTLRELGWMWGKYRGSLNGATWPTHSVETGKPLRPERKW